jgi:hypothetical protein
MSNTALSAKREAEEADASLRPKSLGEFVGREAALGSLAERTYT